MDRAKYDRLTEIVRGAGSALVAFSGGVDSTLLLAVVKDVLGSERTLAVTAISESLPTGDLSEAEELAAGIGAEWTTIRTSELDDPRYRENTRDRCYYCKRGLFKQLVDMAAERGLNAVLDGANADDVGDWRPGHRASRELGVLSPLKEAGITKDEIRELSREFGLPTAGKPAAACLASRIPYGTEVTEEALRAVDRAETSLRELGFEELRVRHHGPVARIELGSEELARMSDASLAASVAERVSGAGFERVSLDLAGFRSGSMNETGDETVHGIEPDSKLLASLGLEGAEAFVVADVVLVALAGEDYGELWTPGRREELVAAFRRRGYVHVAAELAVPAAVGSRSR